MTSNTLLIFAHPGEAQAFYEADLPCTNIFICKEGQTNALYLLTEYLKSHQGEFSRLVNLGIAGSLLESAKLGEIYSIKTVYGEKEFKSFSLADAKAELDLVSAYTRIKDSESKKSLSFIAPIVDRELWALSFVAAKMHLPLYSFKYISDLADESVQCLDIKEWSRSYSEKLLKFYQHFFSLEAESEIKVAELLPTTWEKHFHFSVTQKNKLADLIARLKLVSFKSLFQEELLQECLLHSALPKERSNYLLKKLSFKLNPLMEELSGKLYNEVSALTKIGAKVQFAPDFEENYFTISMKIEHEKNLERLKLGLSEVNFQKIVNLLQGEL
ncbi:MAG: hypothetical protein ACOYL6_18685 [Bacteriovoracaceae bacterium]